MPTDTPPGSYTPFVRVVPHDAVTGLSRWWDDEDLWNNSLPPRGDEIIVQSALDPDCL